MTNREKSASGGIPRGLGRDGPVLLSYGFRPFYLGAGVWAIVTMAIWICARQGWLNLSGIYGQSAWHAHELLFGFMPAVLVGYLMTTVPNWSGRFHFQVAACPSRAHMAGGQGLNADDR